MGDDSERGLVVDPMKGGRTPIHIMRWAPADYHADEHVKLLKARRDYRTLTFYRHFLDASFLAGGDLPSDPEALAAVVEMRRTDVEKGLAFCLGRLIEEDGGRLFQKRIRRDIQAELQFREAQVIHGKHGGRPKLVKASLSGAESPPAPAPAPAPAPTPAPRPAGPQAEEDDLRLECKTLMVEASEATGFPADVILAKASRTRTGRLITNLDSCSSPEWLRVTRDRLLELRLQGEADRQSKPSRARARDPGPEAYDPETVARLKAEAADRLEEIRRKA